MLDGSGVKKTALFAKSQLTKVFMNYWRETKRSFPKAIILARGVTTRAATKVARGVE